MAGLSVVKRRTGGIAQAKLASNHIFFNPFRFITLTPDTPTQARLEFYNVTRDKNYLI